MSAGDPVVSVLITTYNHAPYIAGAIESSLAQGAEFEFEILVGDDASTDGTADIVRDFEQRYSGKLRAFIAERNAGGHANFTTLYQAARGKYVALLEGDDYWTDPAKLAKQVALLESRPDCVLCFHPVRLVDEGGEGDEVSNVGDPAESDIGRITRFNYVHTASCMFRNGVIDGLPDWVFPLPLGDWPLCILLAEHGKLAKLDEVMAAYRTHEGGTWSSMPAQGRLIATVRVAEACRKHLGYPGFDDCILKTSRVIARRAFGNRNYKRWLRYSLKRLGVGLRRPGLAWRAMRKGR